MLAALRERKPQNDTGYGTVLSTGIVFAAAVAPTHELLQGRTPYILISLTDIADEICRYQFFEQIRQKLSAAREYFIAFTSQFISP